MTRASLSGRRSHVSFEVFHAEQHFHVSVGLYEDRGLGEVFITPLGNAGKGSAIEALARDAAILISLGKQYGVPLETMQRAITRNEDGAPMTLVGAVLDACREREG